MTPFLKVQKIKDITLFSLSLFTLDLLIITISILFFYSIKFQLDKIPNLYQYGAIVFISLWILISLLYGKYTQRKNNSIFKIVSNLVKYNITILFIVFFVMYFGRYLEFSRLLVFQVVFSIWAFEILTYIILYYSFQFHKMNESFSSTNLVSQVEEIEEAQIDHERLNKEQSVYIPEFEIAENPIIIPIWQKHLRNHEPLFDLLNDKVKLTNIEKSKSMIIESSSNYNVENLEELSLQFFLNFHRVNDFRRVNQYFLNLNNALILNGIVVLKVKTFRETHAVKISRYGKVVGNFFYFFSFILHRILPKLAFFNGIYYAISKGKNRAFSFTEILGRLYFCGFEFVASKKINNYLWIIVKKTKLPFADKNPSYGPLLKQKRVGHKEKIVKMYKLRTMHPYSEYLQEYVYSVLGTDDGDKATNDFRITNWGKVFRKYWIDELPMLYNLIKGDIKLVGVRPLSIGKFSMYPKDLQKLRTETKPGLVPPYYVDLPKNFDEILESERRYLISAQEKPLTTNFTYFWKAFYNIVFRGARSK